MLLSEQRFREGTGIRYMENGNVRCQALSVSQIRKWREEFDDQETPNEMLWPECQCTKSATPGMFVCRFHGGKRQPKNVRSIMDVIPVDLGEKFKILMDDPIYMSRREDIALMRSRQWQLLENLDDGIGNPGAWELVEDARDALKRGDEKAAAEMLDDAVFSARNEHKAWSEMYELEKLLKDMTGTEVKTAATLKTMATAEEVARLVARVYDILMSGAAKYIGDRQQQALFLGFVSGELGRAVNFSPATVSGLLESGSGEVIGNSE